MKNHDTLIQDFAFFVQKQNECIENGNWREGNKYARKYINCFKTINKIGNEAKEKMMSLLKHENDHVKVSAAAFLLQYNTEECLKILKVISQNPGIVGLEAQQAIKNWNDGSWQLDKF